MIESEIVAPGSLKGVLSGKHYNRCIRAHKMIFGGNGKVGASKRSRKLCQT